MDQQRHRLFFDSTNKEFLRLLQDRGVLYVVIGCHAVNYHGYERHIAALDIVIENSEVNAQRFLSVLSDLKMAW